MTATHNRPVVLEQSGRSQIVEVPHPVSEAMARVLRGAYRIRGARVTDCDTHAGVIVIRTGTTMWSWGDVIVLNFYVIDTELTRIFMSSSPKMRTTVTTWGKWKKDFAVLLSEFR